MGGREAVKTDPKSMTDDDLLNEIVDTVRAGRSHGTWGRERLRAISAEAQKREPLRPKSYADMILP